MLAPCPSQLLRVNIASATAGKPPSAFPQRRLRLDLDSLAASPKMQALLTGLLEPAWEDRLTAAEARAMLAGKAVERPLSVDQAVHRVEQGVQQLLSWKGLQGLGSRARSAWEQATTAHNQHSTPAGTAQVGDAECHTANPRGGCLQSLADVPICHEFMARSAV